MSSPEEQGVRSDKLLEMISFYEERQQKNEDLSIDSITVNGKSYAATGEWMDPNTFHISYELMGYSSRGKWMLTFEGDKIEVKEAGMTGEHNFLGRKVPNL